MDYPRYEYENLLQQEEQQALEDAHHHEMAMDLKRIEAEAAWELAEAVGVVLANGLKVVPADAKIIMN